METLVLFLFFRKNNIGYNGEIKPKGVMMEEKNTNKRWNWIRENGETVAWTGVVLGASALAVVIARKSSRSRKEIQSTLLAGLKNGNAVLFMPNGNISIIPPKAS